MVRGFHTRSRRGELGGLRLESAPAGKVRERGARGAADVARLHEAGAFDPAPTGVRAGGQSRSDKALGGHQDWKARFWGQQIRCRDVVQARHRAAREAAGEKPAGPEELPAAAELKGSSYSLESV